MADPQDRAWWRRLLRFLAVLAVGLLTVAAVAICLVGQDWFRFLPMVVFVPILLWLQMKDWRRSREVRIARRRRWGLSPTPKSEGETPGSRKRRRKFTDVFE